MVEAIPLPAEVHARSPVPSLAVVPTLGLPTAEVAIGIARGAPVVLAQVPRPTVVFAPTVPTVAATLDGPTEVPTPRPTTGATVAKAIPAVVAVPASLAAFLGQVVAGVARLVPAVATAAVVPAAAPTAKVLASETVVRLVGVVPTVATATGVAAAPLVAIGRPRQVVAVPVPAVVVPVETGEDVARLVATVATAAVEAATARLLAVAGLVVPVATSAIGPTGPVHGLATVVAAVVVGLGLATPVGPNPVAEVGTTVPVVGRIVPAVHARLAADVPTALLVVGPVATALAQVAIPAVGVPIRAIAVHAAMVVALTIPVLAVPVAVPLVVPTIQTASRAAHAAAKAAEASRRRRGGGPARAGPTFAGAPSAITAAETVLPTPLVVAIGLLGPIDVGTRPVGQVHVATRRVRLAARASTEGA